MQRFWIGVVLCVVWAHCTQGAEPLPPPAQRALKVAQDVFTPAWVPCGDSVTTQVLPQGGRDAVGFHQIQPVVWTIEEVYPLSSDGKGRQEQTYQVSAYTTRYRSWGGTWTPWNTGMPWEQGNIEIFNARVTLPAKGAPTHAAQYFIFTEGALRKPLCKNIPAG
jgi:hypothetical protein